MTETREVIFESTSVSATPRKLIGNWTVEVEQDLESYYYHPPWYLRIWNALRGRGYYYGCLDSTIITSLLETELQNDFDTDLTK